MWQIEEFDEYIRFTAPSGFIFEFGTAKICYEVLRTVVTSAMYINTRHNETLYISLNGNVSVLKADKWINRDFVKDDVVASNVQLSRALIQYLEERNDRFTSSSSTL